jgi:hypothetical protein
MVKTCNLMLSLKSEYEFFPTLKKSVAAKCQHYQAKSKNNVKY